MYSENESIITLIPEFSRNFPVMGDTHDIIMIAFKQHKRTCETAWQSDLRIQIIYMKYILLCGREMITFLPTKI